MTLTESEWHTQRADAMTCIALARGIWDGQERGLAEFIRGYGDTAYLAAAIALEASHMVPTPQPGLWQAIAALRELAATADAEDYGHG